MSELKLQKVYVETDANEKPLNSGNYFVISENITDNDQQEDIMYFGEKQWIPNNPAQFRCKTWLKEQEGYFMLPDDFITVIWQAMCDARYNPEISINDYIKQLNL